MSLLLLTKSKLKSSPYHWWKGNCLDILPRLPDDSVDLVVTSPPYAIGKAYEKGSQLAQTIQMYEEVIEECHRILKPSGSICWQVGNYAKGNKEVIPLDVLSYKLFAQLDMKLRNRIIWKYNHGLHASARFSGRYEVILWFTKSDDYYFDLDSIRVPQKQPNKRHYKGEKKGQLSCNPLGKNPGDVWEISNLKFNQPEKIPGGHPCQYPTKLIDRLVLSMTKPDDIVLDPFCGVASTVVSAIKNNRIGIGIELESEYYELGKKRLVNASKEIKKHSGASRNLDNVKVSDLTL